MLKSNSETGTGAAAAAAAAGALDCPSPECHKHVAHPRIALLSNPRSTGNLAQLPRIREYCADHPDVFHYEVEHAHQIGEAMKVIAPGPPQGAGHQRRRRHRAGGAD